jgi:hypothetical protein
MKQFSKEIDIYIFYIIKGKKKEGDGNNLMIRSFAI